MNFNNGLTTSEKNYTVVEGIKGYDPDHDIENGVFREKAQDSLAIYHNYVHILETPKDQGYYTYNAIVRIDKNGENISDIALCYLIDRAVHPYVGYDVQRRRNSKGVLFAKITTYKD